MAKPGQVLDIEPQGELRFRGPSTSSPVTSYIKLTNPTNQKVYFKIKTTAPKRYCVRPNNGALKPKDVIEIAVCLQPCEFNFTEKNKHKFMVQSVIAPEGDNDDFVNDVWAEAYPDKVMDYKLKCVFEQSANNPAAPKPTVAPNAAKPDANTTNGKNKGIGDAAKPSSKPMDESEEKLLKAKQEVDTLRVEESNLRFECLQLKEEILKYRNVIDKKSKISSGLMSSGPTERSNPPLSMTSTTAIISVVMVIVGYLLGKMI